MFSEKHRGKHGGLRPSPFSNTPRGDGQGRSVLPFEYWKFEKLWTNCTLTTNAIKLCLRGLFVRPSAPIPLPKGEGRCFVERNEFRSV